MKLYTPDKSLLMEVQAIREHPDGVLIEGKIMGAMPMKAILRPEEARAIFGLMSWRLTWAMLRLIWRPAVKPKKGNRK